MITHEPALRIKRAVAAEWQAWERATELRADAEYVLELFEESSERHDLSEDVIEERREAMRTAIRKAVEQEQEAERMWREARSRAEAEII
jgi:hypothetical protein